jgi:molybdopterin molybdotransferase
VARLPTIDEALASVLGHVAPLAAEDVPVGDALGRVLADPAASAVDLPPFASSAMDGHAVRAADTPGTLRVVGQSAAGRPAVGRVERGEAISISTGGVVPEGADAVVPIEQSETAGDGLRVPETAAGVNVRPRAGDVAAGDVVAGAGMLLGPAQIGALAACGIATVRCARRPRVAVMPTGTELRRPGEPLAPGEIYESNSLLLAAQARSAGGLPEVFAPVADDPGETRAALERALGADVVLTSGGVSVGPHDLVRAALAELGAREVFWRVAVKPGKPVAFATRGATLVFGLPGNPVSSLVAFELFVRPALLALQGAASPAPRFETGRLAAWLARGADRDELVRARIEHAADGVVLHPVAGQESHMIARAAGADALVLVRRGEGSAPAGSYVSFLRL